MTEYKFAGDAIKTSDIFDSHAHFDDIKFSYDRDELLEFLNKKQGVCGIINCGSDIESSKFSVKMAEQFDFVYAAVGYHPEYVAENTPDLELLENLVNENKVVAIGEIGLDYHWYPEKSDIQKKYFEEQIKLALKYDMPVIVHDREAHFDTMAVLKKYKPKGVVHCFSGSVQTAAEIIDMGMYIGVGGVLTFKNSKKLAEVVKAVPIERILLETDAPYMAPEPFRGTVNHSGLIYYVAEKIAQIKNIDIENVFNITKTNCENLFLKNK